MCVDGALDDGQLLGRRGRRWLPDATVRAVRCHGGPGALQRAVDRNDRHVEQRGGLLRGPLDDVPKDQHGALAWRQELNGRQECELDRLARHDDGIGFGLPWRHLVEQSIGIRLQPGDLAERFEGAPARSSIVAANRVQADIRGDPVEPGSEGGRAVKARPAAPRPQVRLLDGVLGLLEGPEHPVRVDVQLASIGFGGHREGGVVGDRLHHRTVSPGSAGMADANETSSRRETHRLSPPLCWGYPHPTNARWPAGPRRVALVA